MIGMAISLGVSLLVSLLHPGGRVTEEKVELDIAREQPAEPDPAIK